MILGSHVSYSQKNGFVGSVKEAISYGANTFMFYTGAPQNTVRKDICAQDILQAHELMQQAGIDIENVICHAPYIINMANTTKPETFDLAVSFLVKELNRVEQFGVKYLVLHPGSHVNAGVEVGLKRIVEGLNLVFEQVDNDVIVCLETMAGKGSEIGSKFEEIKYIIDHVKQSNRLAVCLDTCHLFDAGYDIQNQLDQVLVDFDKIIGLDRIKVVHLNDSKNELFSSKDRHANIGDGMIGLDALVNVINHPSLKQVPFILETPYIDNQPIYEKEIALLKEKSL